LKGDSSESERITSINNYSYSSKKGKKSKCVKIPIAHYTRRILIGRIENRSQRIPLQGGKGDD